MTTPTTDQEFVITHIADAPRERVWKAFTEREQLMRWFGPKNFVMPRADLDLRPGGTFHYGLRSPDGLEMWGKWTFREIEAPEKIVHTSTFSDAEGNVTRHPLAPTWPLTLLATFTFAERDGQTEITVRWSPLDATEEERATFAGGHGSMTQGWSGTFQQLDEYLANA
jgi:uncharacterized protein YndB with AHSA1/START domain